MRRALAIALSVLGSLAALAVIAVLILTQTGVGHQVVRRVALRALRGPVHGIVRIGELDGDLLHDVILHDVGITDSAGHPFLTARRIQVHFALGDLLHRRLFLDHLWLDHPVVVLERTPPPAADGRWNVVRIFVPSSHIAGAAPDSTLGWGSWISIRDARVTHGTLIARPITEVHDLNAVMPLVRLADPRSSVKLVQVGSLQASVAAETLAPVTVRDLMGTVSFTGDSLWTAGAAITLPASAIQAAGTYGFDSGEVTLNLRAQPAALADLRFLSPHIPATGQLAGDATILIRPTTQLYQVRDLVLTTGAARITGHGGIERSDSLRILDTDMRFTGIDTHLVRDVAPTAHIPTDGVLQGRAALSGGQHLLAVNADVIFANSRFGSNHMALTGSLGVGGTATHPVYSAHALTLTLEPAHLELAQMVAPAFPFRGALSGTATVDGSTADSVTIRTTMHAHIAPVRGAFTDTLDIDTLSLNGTIVHDVLRVDTTHVRIHALTTTLDAAGTLGLRSNVDGRLTYRLAVDSIATVARVLAMSDTMRAHLDSLTGRLVATGDVRGSAHHFDLSGALSAFALAGFGASVDSLEGSFTWAGGPSRDASILATVHAVGVSARHIPFDTVNVRLALSRPTGDLTFDVRRTQGQEYAGAAHIMLDSAETSVRYDSLFARIDSATIRSEQPGTVTWGATGLGLEDVALRAAPGNGRIRVDGTLPLGAPAATPVHIALVIDSLPIETAATLAQHPVGPRGTVSLQATLAGTAGHPTVSGSGTLTDGGMSAFPIPDVHVRIGYDTTTLTVHAEMERPIAFDSAVANAAIPSLAAQVATPRPFLVADGTVPIDLALTDTGARILDRPLTGRIETDSLPLALLPIFLPSVSNADGEIHAHATVGGTPHHPVVRGELALSGGRLHITDLGISLNQVASHVSLLGDTLRIDSLVARNRGPIRVQGTIDVSDFAVLPVDLTMTARGARVVDNTTWGRFDIDDSLAIAGPAFAAYVYGTVRVRRGIAVIPDVGGRQIIDAGSATVYYVADTANPAVLAVIPKPSPLIANLRMDVDVSVDRDTWVRNKAANVEVYTEDPLTVRINPDQHAVVVDGTVNTDRGQYTFFSKRFQITHGMATFVGTQAFDPTVQATGQYAVVAPGRPPLNILILIGGTVTAPHLALSSDAEPPLSQTDLFTYLAFGSPAAQLASGTSSGTGGGSSAGSVDAANLAGSVGPYVTQRLAGVAIGTFTQELQGDVARSLGANVFNITPTPGVPTEVSSNGLTGYLRNTELEFGKYMTSSTYVGLDLVPVAPPGAKVETRLGKQAMLALTLQPWYLADPTLSPSANITTKDVFGLSLTRDWRF
jgi:hypothetical protein